MPRNRFPQRKQEQEKDSRPKLGGYAYNPPDSCPYKENWAGHMFVNQTLCAFYCQDINCKLYVAPTISASGRGKVTKRMKVR